MCLVSEPIVSLDGWGYAGPNELGNFRFPLIDDKKFWETSLLLAVRFQIYLSIIKVNFARLAAAAVVWLHITLFAYHCAKLPHPVPKFVAHHFGLYGRTNKEPDRE